MFKYILPTLACCLIFSYQKVSSLTDISWDSVNEKTLVVFDVDDVLIVSTDQFGHPEGMDEIKKLFMGFVLKYGIQRVEKCASLLFLRPKRVLVEENSPQLVRDLQKKGASVIGLTNCQRGSFGEVESIEDWRVKHLGDLGFLFNYADKTAPLLHGGILFSKGYTKGEVLKQFINTLDAKPEKVVFVDDLVHNLNSVAQTIDLPCETYQYTGAEPFYKPVDREKLIKQLTHLLDNEEWLPDELVN